MKTASVFPAIVLCLSLILAACDDDDDEPEPTATPAATQQPAPTATSAPQPTPTPAGSTDPVTVPANPDPPAGVSILQDVRVGEHPEGAGFDRIVFEFEDGLPAAEVRYEDAVVGCGTGEPIEVEGEAFLLITMIPSQAHDDAGMLTIDAVTVEGTGEAILQARQSCDFEADVTWGIGVPEERPFVVTILEDPTRLVVDIAH
jgi:hypothetical protein